jgi:hypothetical protein
MMLKNYIEHIRPLYQTLTIIVHKHYLETSKVHSALYEK